MCPAEGEADQGMGPSPGTMLAVYRRSLWSPATQQGVRGPQQPAQPRVQYQPSGGRLHAHVDLGGGVGDKGIDIGCT